MDIVYELIYLTLTVKAVMSPLLPLPETLYLYNNLYLIVEVEIFLHCPLFYTVLRGTPYNKR